MAEFSTRNIIYDYDGTFEGFLCCAFESFTLREIPANILNQKDFQPGLFEHFNIITDIEKANLVKKSIQKKMNAETLVFLEDALLTSLKHKEMFMLDFMRIGYKTGRKIINMLADDTVIILTKAVKQMTHEAHKFTGFTRFSVHGNLLIAKIKPKNFVLQRIVPHFAARMPNEKFIIYDETHNMICAYAKGKYVISDISDIKIPEAEAKEYHYRNLWEMFYDTTAIEERKNPKHRIILMPKRYWSNMTEF
ncbi:MAG: TIGR03915 family putative DNA repair protein [Endomicrobium sp.]|jgi:probable DNA metabolism protein|nr:TIGR03915 family putative DNA repair protein [Endomicrobium sp.]